MKPPWKGISFAPLCARNGNGGIAVPALKMDLLTPDRLYGGAAIDAGFH